MKTVDTHPARSRGRRGCTSSPRCRRRARAAAAPRDPGDLRAPPERSDDDRGSATLPCCATPSTRPEFAVLPFVDRRRLARPRRRKASVRFVRSRDAHAPNRHARAHPHRPRAGRHCGSARSRASRASTARPICRAFPIASKARSRTWSARPSASRRSRRRSARRRVRVVDLRDSGQGDATRSRRARGARLPRGRYDARRPRRAASALRTSPPTS